MGKIFRAACVQLCGGRNVQQNLERLCRAIFDAASRGADYIQTPEQSLLMELDKQALFEKIRPENETQELDSLCALAAELGVWLHIGSIAVRVSSTKACNRSYVISPDGNIVARYDKIHLFDVSLAGGEVYRESDNYRAGTQAQCVDLPWGRLGLSICYDLRFSALYSALAQAGCLFIAAPSAFTVPTGRAHWHILVRARAIESGCFVIAATQAGHHENGRRTYGHSIIVSPWGDILAEADDDEQVIMADIRPELAMEMRAQIPVLANRQRFALPEID